MKIDYDENLGLEKGYAAEEVGKTYCKLSVKVHPDKNKAPGAEEAFKAISKTIQCLNNEENGKKPDLVGSDEPALVRRAARRRNNSFNGFYYDEDFGVDEIFTNFGGVTPVTAGESRAPAELPSIVTRQIPCDLPFSAEYLGA